MFLSPGNQFSSILSFCSSESKLKAVFKYSSRTGQAFQGMTPQSEDTNGCDEVIAAKLGTAISSGVELLGKKSRRARIHIISRKVIKEVSLIRPRFTVQGSMPLGDPIVQGCHSDLVNTVDQGSKNCGFLSVIVWLSR